MRNPLYKRIPRELRKNCLKYIGMILILVCTICVGTSFQATLNAAQNYLNDIKDANVQEDGYFETASPVSDEIITHFEEDGIRVYENFYATENDFEDSSKIILFNERNEIDIPTVFEGRLPEKADEIALDHVFASNRGISIGETIKLLGNEYKITGTVALPDYTSLFMNNTDLVMNTNHFCVSVLSEEGFDELEGRQITYRYSYRLDDRGLKDSKKVTISEDMQKYLIMNGATLQSFLRKDQNQSISFLEMDIGTDGPFITVFVYILVGLIAFIFAILTNNTIENEAVIIGTLRASGYKKGEIIWHYLQPTFIVAIIGSALGNAIGYTLMLKPFEDLYYTSYSVGRLNIKFSIPMFVTTTILPVVIMIGINYLMMARKLSLSPLKFLRKELKKGKRRKSIKLPNLSFINRFRLRVIIQNLGSYIMLFIGVFLASFLLMFGIGMDPLMKHYTDEIDKSLPYEYQYILKGPVDIEQGEKVFVYEMDSWFSLGQKDVDVAIYGIDKDTEFFEGAYSEDGIVISSATANKLGLKSGDTLKLKDTNKEKEYEFEIKAVYDYSATLAVFMDKSDLNELLDVEDGTYNCILSDTKLDIEENLIVKQISRTDMIGAANQMMDSFEVVIVVMNVFSVVVYIIMIYILTRVVIDKNALSISYMKVFGYNAKEIRKLYLTTTTIVVIASLLVCIPLEIELFKLTLIFMSVLIEGYMEFYLPVWVYIAIVVIGIVAYFAINALNILSVKKIPMTDALKNRE